MALFKMNNESLVLCRFTSRVASILGATFWASIALETVPAAAHSYHDHGTLVAQPRPQQQINVLQGLSEKSGDIARAVIDQFKVWAPGETLKICFLDGSNALKDFFVRASGEWLKYANIDFDFGEKPAYRDCKEPNHIRVTFLGPGNWSYVGIDSLKVSHPNPSIQIGYATSAHFGLISKDRLRGIMLHEIGHSLGLEHEHQSPEAGCEDELDWDKIYASLGWSKAEIDRNFRQIVSGPQYSTTPYDPKSIMHYNLPAWMFKNGEASHCYGQENTILSQTDKNAISAIYPEDKDTQLSVLKSREARVLDILRQANLSTSDLKAIIQLINNASPNYFRIDLQNIGSISGDNIQTGDKSPVMKGINTNGGDFNVDIR